MKLKTKLIGSDREGVVTFTVESDNNGACLTRHEQEERHNRAVNNAHAALRGRFDVLRINVKR